MKGAVRWTALIFVYLGGRRVVQKFCSGISGLRFNAQHK